MDWYVLLAQQCTTLTCQSSRTDIRRNAFAKLATLSSPFTTTTQAGGRSSDLDRLAKGLQRPPNQANGFLNGVFGMLAPTSRVPMGIRELDIILALCEAAPSLKDLGHAEKLASQLSSYLPEAHIQLFASSPFLHEIQPSPWAALTYRLTNALLTLGIHHSPLRDTVLQSVQSYIDNCTQSAEAVSSIPYHEQTDGEHGDPQEAAETASIAVSLLGFMEAAAIHEDLWTSFERVKLIQQLQTILSERFLVAIETASSTIRNSSGSDYALRNWRKYLRRYAAKGTPLGAMLLQQGFMRLVLACTSRLLTDEDHVQSGDLLHQYITGVHLERAHGQEVDDEMIEYLVEVVSDQIRVLEDGSDYLQLSSAWQQRLAFSVKAFALEAFLHCMVIDEEIADAETLFGWLEDSLANQVQMADEDLADIVLKSLAVVAKYIPEGASNFARLILRFIVSGSSRGPVVAIAAESLSHILRALSQDAVITTLNSLGNILSSGSGAEKAHHPTFMSPDVAANHHNSIPSTVNPRTGSVISLAISGDEETSLVCGNVAHAIVTLAESCGDSRITALAQTMILQKLGKINMVVDARILEEAARLAVHGKENELRALLRFFLRLHMDAMRGKNDAISNAISNAREYLALHIDNKSPLFRVYVVHLLECILAKGDVAEDESDQTAAMEQAAREIGLFLKPLSTLASRKPIPHAEGSIDGDDEILALVREVWFNIAIHDISLQSKLGQQYHDELRILASHSQPLVDVDRAELLESDVELNTTLRRGRSQLRTTDQRKRLAGIIPSKESEFRHLSYQKVVFLNAVFLVESLRAASGNCAEVLSYFLDPTMRDSAMGHCMTAIAERVIKIYTDKALPANEERFSASYVSRQLAKILAGCCHRSEKLQQIATASADHVIALAPSALCQKSALFALLELLTLMWSSCLEAEIEEYEWKSTFTSARGKITIELSDDYAFRKRTLNKLYANAKKWVTDVMGIAPLDVKGLLQTYLSEFDDTGAYGHIALGRSFALDMGTMIPPLDPRLGAIDRKGDIANVNVASDFMAQYTTRQEYRFSDLPEHDRNWFEFMNLKKGSETPPSSTVKATGVNEEANAILAELERRTIQGKHISIAELRDVLRGAAALLCRSKKTQSAIVHHLVHIPFEIFTKDSIKLGISLWLGVIHENPRMEPRILTEIASAWEKTIDRKVGIFSKRFQHPDPFYVKQEFAPSDKAVLMRQQQTAQNLIAPHLRVLQFFESHFNAIRLGSPNTQRTFIRMITKTLAGFQNTCSHPLTREIHFHAVLFGLRILRYNTCLTRTSTWRLRDQIFSAALRWFKQPSAWSFGGNRLQMKAEVTIMTNILSAIQNPSTSVTATRKSLQQKQDLLEILLQSEVNRLSVWLFPLGSDHGDHPVHDPSIVAKLLKTAWIEHPGIAIQLVNRFSSFETVRNDVRFLLLNFPEKALQEAEAVSVLLGDTLPSDISFQLKYLLYWAPVNPIQAVTYLLPGYKYHPFVLQYGMRALESHAVDVTFFYVPQVVQALRYDELGYVERYIVETGSFSQLFAHQIIWNIKANAYKDEDATEPDPIKPIFDRVIDNLISSFSREDREFYEREFAFFGEVTDISGKLKPFIKKSKPEKKQKIEEELRKIKAEVGVYLPSNPDGVVVGIDRKSGKPLQSHAKAPFMATFRIRKPSNQDNENVSKMIESAPQHQAPEGRTTSHRTKRPSNAMESNRALSSAELSTISTHHLDAHSSTYEVWQSAIFKVGDDCRQDVLALQMIAVFRSIFNSVGLDVYVYPYRVTATAPGCGVIDVLPNSISRDMLGREAVNGLYDYFVTKYGGEHSVRFQQARAEFVKSMAAYSVVSYLLQFKDRHNGNIMVDDKGHILHIDFGFCFDIAPGGVRFERAPFKLTPEMIAVMGGNKAGHNSDAGKTSQSYRWFEELTIKAFLASRQYCGKLCHLVSLMLDSGLPCFKPETMRNFKSRFVLEKTEREAAEFMRTCIKQSEGNVSTKVYDEFQLLTNGIPY
jgi:phosphatidylinositol 4-kinase A